MLEGCAGIQITDKYKYGSGSIKKDKQIKISKYNITIYREFNNKQLKVFYI